jgi:hypothetical protein
MIVCRMLYYSVTIDKMAVHEMSVDKLSKVKTPSYVMTAEEISAMGDMPTDKMT